LAPEASWSHHRVQQAPGLLDEALLFLLRLDVLSQVVAQRLDAGAGG
jgi:hypothetical protein